jgi:hypothetical protein
MENAKIKNMYDLSQSIAGEYLSQFTYPWEALKGISDFIKKLGPTLDPEIYEKRGENIWVAKSATVAPTACLNGPLIIDEDAEIRHCAFIRGNAIVGEGAVVGNSTEIKNDIIFNTVQVPHYNYVGDSILGYKSHMGAGSITSNVKSDKTLVVVKDSRDSGEEIESSYLAKKWSTNEGGGYIWHTTGSGKTLTSFKAARLATQLDFIDKVFFVVDRKDLDFQRLRFFTNANNITRTYMERRNINYFSINSDVSVTYQLASCCTCISDT